MTQRKQPKHFGLMLMFAFMAFLTMLINSVITSGLMYVLIKGRLLSAYQEVVPYAGMLLLFNSLLSVPVAFLVAVVTVKFPLKPVRTLIDGMDALASGNLKTRVNVGSIMRNYPDFVAVCESFNKMAEQLENTEMLRSDFINNFSHEFKTPIVSIAGFAKLLKKGNLPPQQQKEYLDIIEQESLRLSYMATNVLNLTKVENQTILTDVTQFNLSEQIRSCILMLERKWSCKNLELQLEFGEYTIQANEELLKQVWLNLLDNAVKFTPEGHTVRVQITQRPRGLEVAVTNTGSQIPLEHQKKIFNKFYQADESHATQGNGVGLAVVKRIVQLHGGEVWVRSADDITTFTVLLPDNPGNGSIQEA